MAKSHEMLQHMGADMPPRFYVDGRRVSRDTYETIMEKAHRFGRVECFWTKGKQMGGGRIRRTNGCVAVTPRPPP